MSRTATRAHHYLPNFGSFAMAARFLIFAELLAIIITIGRNHIFDEQAWQELSLLSAFALTIAFCSIVVLKLAPPLHELHIIPERWPPWRDSLLMRSLLISAITGTLGMHYLILKYHSDRDAKSQQESRMQALQSRIRPHFLFNSLNSVASLTHSDPKRAEAVLHDLADLFRVLLADARKLGPLSAGRGSSRPHAGV